MLKPVECSVSFQSGIFGRGRAIFDFGHMKVEVNVKTDEFERILDQQQVIPIPVGTYDGHQYWGFQGKFYREAEGLAADEVHALIVAAEMEHQASRDRQIARAKAMVAQGPQEAQLRREHITVEVRNFVFQRDGGQCQVCGSTVELQFDHGIPVKLGGSSEPENLQLLCGPCNRRKGASLG